MNWPTWTTHRDAFVDLGNGWFRLSEIAALIPAADNQTQIILRGSPERFLVPVQHQDAMARLQRTWKELDHGSS